MRHLGEVDITAFKACLLQQPDELWNADQEFQKRVAPYRKSRTIYLLMTRRLTGWDPLHAAFDPLAQRIASFYPRRGRVLNAQVACLGPGDDIPEHEDFGPTLEAAHRVHVPIETHPDVQFWVEGQDIKLAVGQAYELDNLRRHSVLNASPVRRIHLIVDYFEEPL
jgi:hypothetical protein